MASHLAAQDYLARLQASGLNFPGLAGAADPYSSLGLSSLNAHHSKPSKTSKSSNASSASSSSSSLPKSQQSSHAREKGFPSSSSLNSHGGAAGKSGQNPKSSSGSPMPNSKGTAGSSSKYSGGLTIQAAGMKLPSHGCSSGANGDKKSNKANEQNFLKGLEKSKGCSASSPSIFTSPLSMASNVESSGIITSTQSTMNNVVPSLSSSILR